MDPRSMRSRQLLRDALATTLDTLPFERITVVLLTKRAGVNRSTFYQHYATTSDLLIDLVNVRLDETGLAEFDPFELDISSEQPPEFVTKLTDFVESARPIYVSKLTTSAQNTLCVQFMAHLSSVFTHVLACRKPDYVSPLVFISAPALAGSITGPIWAWLQDPDPPAKEDMEGWLWKVIRLALRTRQERYMAREGCPGPVSLN
ncbi:TetR/AcrR family transcriptional regulator [Bowdeniella nasicola]|uniref:TetR/AcrR family transcriptional regulator n=1 Tax=Bowdeniella nasicola TaxID=208480 RepID=UPI001161443A|nr:TetR/AcrR family transcriptional regulator [Bowdeniella nasicola]